MKLLISGCRLIELGIERNVGTEALKTMDSAFGVIHGLTKRISIEFGHSGDTQDGEWLLDTDMHAFSGGLAR